MKNGNLQYRLSKKAAELGIKSPRRKAVVTQKEVQKMKEELREIKGILQQSEAVIEDWEDISRIGHFICSHTLFDVYSPS